jgi:hypothetical protein
MTTAHHEHQTVCALGEKMANLTRTTRDHEEIRRWAEERGGKPSHVRRTGSGEDVGILRIDFPGYSGEGSLEPITWEQWFEKFDEQGLSLIYEEETAGGARSNFNKLVSAGTAAEAEAKSARKKPAKKAASGKSAAQKKGSAPAKKTSKSATKKAAGKKTAAKKPVGKKAAVKKAAVKKATSKSTKKSAGKKSAAKKKR